jgi:hypothetical protein
VCLFERLGDLPAMERLSSKGNDPDSRALRQGRAFDELHHEGRVPSDFFEPKIEAMLGWWSWARSCASRSNLARRSLSSVNAAGRTLIATSRLSLVSCR